MTASIYDRLREEYRPRQLRVLLIGESPPRPHADPLRFFYAPDLAPADNLYRGVTEALYGRLADFDLSDKRRNLARLADDGYWLIDAVQHPINHLPRSTRMALIQAEVPRLIERCGALAPTGGVIICHSVVFGAIATRLKDEGVRVLHDDPLPFPLGNWRRKFIDGFRSALAADRRAVDSD